MKRVLVGRCRKCGTIPVLQRVDQRQKEREWIANLRPMLADGDPEGIECQSLCHGVGWVPQPRSDVMQRHRTGCAHDASSQRLSLHLHVVDPWVDLIECS